MERSLAENENIEEKNPLLLKTRPDGSEWSDQELRDQARILDIVEKDSIKTRKQNLHKKRVRQEIEGLKEQIGELKKEYFFLRREEKKECLRVKMLTVVSFLRELKEELVRKAGNDLKRLRKLVT